MVLPETNAKSAILIAERCRQLILDEVIPHRGSKLGAYLTISQGVNTIVPTVKDKVSTFVERVDWLLYQAKQKGRNRVVAHEGE